MIPTFTLLLCCQLGGEVLARLLHLPVPGPVLGMSFLFAVLLLRPRTLVTIQDTSSGLLRHLSILFVPAGVGIMLHFARIRAELVAIAVSLVFSTALTIAASALAFQWAARALDKEGARADEQAPALRKGGR